MGCDNCNCHVYPIISGKALSARMLQLKNFSGLMVVGESPTAIEAVNNQVMTGAGAKILQETLAKVGLPYKPEEVYYTTAIKCAIPKKKGSKIPASAPVNCRDYLLNEIRALEPRMILVCGATALATLTGNDKLKVTEMYGRVLDPAIFDVAKYVEKECTVIPIMNPGVLVHKPGDYKPFLSYLQLASTIFNGGKEVDTGVTEYEVLDTPDKVKALWQKMMRLHREGKLDVASYDIETTGLDYRIVEFLVLGICFEKNHAYVIPREMRAYVHNFLENVPWQCIWQNGKQNTCRC